MDWALGVLDADHEKGPHGPFGHHGLHGGGDMGEVLRHPAIRHVQHRETLISVLIVAGRRVDVDSPRLVERLEVDRERLRWRNGKMRQGVSAEIAAAKQNVREQNIVFIVQDSQGPV
jgi:hypothetical protein